MLSKNMLSREISSTLGGRYLTKDKYRASVAVNNETLFTAWSVGKYVSDKLKNEEWRSKVVSQLSEYIRSKRPDVKGFSKRNLYNMVMFYDEYSSETFAATIRKYMTDKFVQSETAQIGLEQENAIIVQSGTALFVQSQTGQMPNILTLTTLTNHIEILCKRNTTGTNATAVKRVLPVLFNRR